MRILLSVPLVMLSILLIISNCTAVGFHIIVLHARPGGALVFLLGQVTDKLVMSELREENLASGDLVQISVRDHYTALSYKTLSGFIWVNR